VDSYIKLWLLCLLSHRLSHDGPDLGQFFEDVPDSSLHGLGGLDYHKLLIAEIMACGPGLFGTGNVLGLSGLKRVIDDASFRRLKSAHVNDFNLEAFLRVRSSISPHLESSLMSSYVDGQEA
jgi:hypothetical protein